MHCVRCPLLSSWLLSTMHHSMFLHYATCATLCASYTIAATHNVRVVYNVPLCEAVARKHSHAAVRMCHIALAHHSHAVLVRASPCMPLCHCASVCSAAICAAYSEYSQCIQIPIVPTWRLTSMTTAARNSWMKTPSAKRKNKRTSVNAKDAKRGASSAKPRGQFQPRLRPRLGVAVFVCASHSHASGQPWLWLTGARQRGRAWRWQALAARATATPACSRERQA